MGSNNEKANDREKPAHTVYIDAFCIDKYPVTNAQYNMFLDANPQWRKPSERNKRNKARKLNLSKYHDGRLPKTLEWRLLSGWEG